MYSARICCVKEIYCSLRSSNLHIHFLPFQQENARDDIASLKKELAAIRQLHDAGSVDSALSLLRQHLARPSGIFDPHAALEQLVDVARDKSDERASRFSIVLRQTRPLLLDPSFQPLGDKEATDLACAQRRYPCNTSGFSRQSHSGPQGSHLPIYANPLWFSVSFAKLRPSGPALNFLPLPPPLRRRMHLSSISVLRPSASPKSRFP